MNDKLWIDWYKTIVEKSRKLLVTKDVTQEKTFENAALFLFARITLTMFEIHTLLNNNYPEGALALSRTIIEGSVILNYICDNKCDSNLMERFFDDAEISALKMIITTKKFLNDDTVVEDETQLRRYVDKYKSFYDETKFGFSDYWWVNKNCSFGNLIKKTELSKNYTYMITSKTLHMSAFNCQNYCGKKEEGILVGPTKDGLEFPAWISMLYYTMAMDFLTNCKIIDYSELIKLSQILVERITKKECK